MPTVLAITAAWAESWAPLAPRQFDDSFPGAGRYWILVDGADSKHLTSSITADLCITWPLHHFASASLCLCMYGSLNRIVIIPRPAAGVALRTLLCLA